MKSDPLDSFVMTIYQSEVAGHIEDKRIEKKREIESQNKKYIHRYENEAGSLFKHMGKLLRNS
mgnify:FL=1